MLRKKAGDSSQFMIRMDNFVTFKHIALLTKPMMHSVVQRCAKTVQKLSEDREK